jgi:hypothetical protein
MLPGASQPFFSPHRGRSLVTAFPSPATTPACAKPIPGSKVPTCYFAPCYLALLPVRPFCSTTNAGSPRLRPLPRFWPVAASPNNPAGCAFCLHSPPGLLPPSGSKRSAEFAARQARLPNPPDFLSLPAARFLSLDFLAADHRSWSATFPEACCSSNLLEPLPICPHNGFSSTLIVVSNSFFLKIYFLCFESVTVKLRCIFCG